MLQNFPYYAQIMLHYALLIQHFLFLIIPKLHNHEYQQPFWFFYSLNNLSTYTYKHFEFPFATLVNTYLTKSLPHINPNLTILAKHVFDIIFSIMLAIFAYYAGIMLNAFITPLCLKLCWHNRLKPSCCNRTDKKWHLWCNNTNKIDSCRG